MTAARIALYVSALIYFVVSCMSAGIKVDERLKAIGKGYDYDIEPWREVMKMLPEVCMPAAIVVLLTYLISCVDKD